MSKSMIQTTNAEKFKQYESVLQQQSRQRYRQLGFTLPRLIWSHLVMTMLTMMMMAAHGRCLLATRVARMQIADHAHTLNCMQGELQEPESINDFPNFCRHSLIHCT